MSQDYEITLSGDAGIYIGISIERVTIDAFDECSGIHLYVETEKAREIAEALIASADRLAKESKQ